MTRLDSIQKHNQSNRLYLAVFATMLGIVALVSASGVGMVVVEHLASR
jgi:hypothetical protein